MILYVLEIFETVKCPEIVLKFTKNSVLKFQFLGVLRFINLFMNIQ